MNFKPLPKPMTDTEKREKYPLGLTENFSLWEVVCSCCGFFIINSELLHKLQQLRYRINRPIYVNSWYRCNHHNKNVGGSRNSYHQYGMATDIRTAGLSPQQLAVHARAVGFHVIVYETYIHGDIR